MTTVGQFLVTYMSGNERAVTSRVVGMGSGEIVNSLFYRTTLLS